MNEGKKVKAAVGRGPSEGPRPGMGKNGFTERVSSLVHRGRNRLTRSLDLISRKSGARSIQRFARSFLRYTGGFCVNLLANLLAGQDKTDRRPAIGRVHGCVTPNKSSISSDKIEISATASSDFALTNHVPNASASALPALPHL